MNLLAKNQDSRSLQLAAGGFRDLTRVASSPYEIWDDILQTNKKEVSRSLGMLIRELQLYRKSVSSGRLEKLEAQFSNAKKLRDAIPRDMKGFHRPLVDILVSVEDKPGTLSKVSTALCRHRINIKDIELLKVREGETGTFRLSFETEKVARRVMDVLKKTGYKTTIR
jgi:prephenate dehydrogenase